VSSTALVKAGTLGYELKGHAFERATTFFSFLLTMKLVIAELNAIGGAGTPHRFSKWVSVKATDQIGSGLRSEVAEYTPFVKTNPKVVDQSTTLFTKSDAAHFCNLGLTLGFDAICNASPFTRDGYRRLKVYAGATMQLPQKVNIGPDRKIDIVHGRLAPAMLDDDKPIFSRDRVTVYQKHAVESMTEYKKLKARLHEHGLEACAECYLATYATEFEDRVFRRVYPEVIGLCESSPHFRERVPLFLGW
jgi:hypothetical protein